MRRLLISLVVIVVALAWARESAALDVKLDGRWRQSALREDFTVQTWLNAGCGPPPSSSSTGGGEVVEVRTEGDELVFVGGGRVYRTNTCYDPMPNLQRGAHSRDSSGKSWRTRCSTAPNDPRSAVLNTYVNASTDTHMDLIETGRYEITLEGGKCIADIKRTRGFDKLPDDSTPATAATSATAPVPTPAKTNDTPRPALCGIVGDPTKLEVRPSRKLLRPGETFRFRGAVLDAKGCETKTATTWRLSPDGAGKGLKVDTFGNVTAAADAPEGDVDIIATAAGKDAHVTVEVVSAARYDQLLAQSGLNAEGENDEASTATIASQSIGQGDTIVDDTGRKQRKAVFLAIIGALLAVLALAGVVLRRRGRRANELVEEIEDRHRERVGEVLERRKQREMEHAAQMRAHEDSVRAHHQAVSAPPTPMPTPAAPRATLVCGKCGREMEAGTSFCPHDGTPLVAARDAKKATGGGICPACSTVYGVEVTRCPKDGESLIPYPVPALAQAKPRLRGKICPTCGERFDGASDFCGKDGSQLVLLN